MLTRPQFPLTDRQVRTACQWATAATATPYIALMLALSVTIVLGVASAGALEGSARTIWSAKPYRSYANGEHAPDGLNQGGEWPVADQVGGTTSFVSVDGASVYYGVGPRILALDVTDAASPVSLWQSDVILDATPLLVERSTAIFASGAGLVLAEASPGFPVVSTIPLPGRPDEASMGTDGLLSVVGVADRRTTLWLALVDTSVPESASIVGQMSWSSDWFWIPHVASDGEVVALAFSVGGDDDFAELVLVDATDVESPRQLSRLQLPSPYATGVLLDLPLAFVNGYDDDGRLHVLDVAEPELPAIAAVLELARDPTDMAMVGDLLAVSMASFDYEYWEDPLGRVQLWDVSEPTRPVEVSMVRTSDDAVAMEVLGHDLFLAASSAGLQRLDCSNPAQPRRSGDWQTWPAMARSVALMPDELTLAVHDSPLMGRGSYVVLVDASSNGTLSTNSAVTVPFGLLDPMAAGGENVYFTHDATPEDSSDRAVRFGTVDATDVTTPIVIGSDLVLTDTVSALSAQQTILLAANRERLVSVDMSVPDEPMVVSVLEHDGLAADVVAEGGRAYVFRSGHSDSVEKPESAESHAVEVLHVADSGRLQVLGRLEMAIELEPMAKKVVVDDGMVVVNGRHVVDFSDPNEPVWLVSGQRGDGAASTFEAVAIRDGHLVLGSAYCLRAIDIEDPGSPVQVGAWPLGVADVLIAGDGRVYASAIDDGLFELALANPPMSDFSYSCRPLVWRVPQDGRPQLFLPSAGS